MKLRRRYDELTAEVSALLQQRELLLTQISDDKAEWEKLQRVSSVAGRKPTFRHTAAVVNRQLIASDPSSGNNGSLGM
jgi:hypothetical protein